MANFMTLACGAPYPLPMSFREGAAAQFFSSTHNFIQIALPGVMSSEVRAIRKSTVKAGYIKDGPMILWVFTFGDIIFECPFDARKIPADLLSLPVINTEKQRLAVDIHLVDTTTNMLHALRSITLAPALSARFISDVRNQLSDPRSDAPYLAHLGSIDIQTLSKMARVERCGT